MKRFCVYCGSNSGVDPAYIQAATELGRLIAESGAGLVYGGASVGLMGAIADAVMDNGGEVIGVIPQAIVELELAHSALTDLRVVADMHERKAMMAELSDGFVAMPGGVGTLEEIFESLTWLHLGLHDKPCALFNVNAYYDSLINFLNQSVAEGFVKQSSLDKLFVTDQAAQLVDLLNAG